MTAVPRTFDPPVLPRTALELSTDAVIAELSPRSRADGPEILARLGAILAARGPEAPQDSIAWSESGGGTDANLPIRVFRGVVENEFHNLRQVPEVPGPWTMAKMLARGPVRRSPVTQAALRAAEPLIFGSSAALSMVPVPAVQRFAGPTNGDRGSADFPDGSHRRTRERRYFGGALIFVTTSATAPDVPREWVRGARVFGVPTSSVRRISSESPASRPAVDT
jgi:hypothetical protein